MEQLATQVRRASGFVAKMSTAERIQTLLDMARILRESTKEILIANTLDMSSASEKPEAFRDRLFLNESRIESAAKAIESVAALECPLGEITDSWTRPNGLKIRKVRIPLGVILMVYEARPNVTTDAAALCLMSGNAAILRGGSESFRTNQVFASVIQKALSKNNIPTDAIVLVPDTSRESFAQLLECESLIDLCIPRGGTGLIQFVSQHAKIPVVKHAQGVCHVYVHEKANVKQAIDIVINAKTSRPGVCNAAECLLIDESIATQTLPLIARALREKNVELRAEMKAAHILKANQIDFVNAQPTDFGCEFLSLILAVKVVSSFDEAVSHIAQFGSEHTEAIVTEDSKVATRFLHEVMASSVVHNASTRFNDGGELGFGAEIGISTSRLHAFGPMGLKELTSQKHVIEGNGQVR
jgi:glutamate-5-semialdehyde dehydrogenase